MISFPNAKINLGLHGTERRPDGYHNLETLFYPVSLADILEVIPGTSFSFESSGLLLDAEPDSNLVVRAYQLLKEAYDLPPVNIWLHKVIPFGAGLGGGSSDAAFMLKMLNELFGLNIPTDQLKQFAVLLGADCPFFLDNVPAYATGIGDQLVPFRLDLSAYKTVLVKPPFGVNTALAYRSITPKLPARSLAEILNLPPEHWKELLVNDFEEPVFKLFPELSVIKAKMYDSGAVYASMSGSGSALFGLFSTPVPALRTRFGDSCQVFD
jgi:4-diphosphocytidyl-2-C-methyl-D-erythritol kinase